MTGGRRRSDPSGAPRPGRALAAALLLAAWGCRPAEPPSEIWIRGEALGTAWSVKVVSRGAPGAGRRDDLRRRVTATLERVDRGMSNWREDAELSRFNRGTGSTPVRFSPETRRVITAALELARETGGAFDPTVAPLVAAWGFGPDPATEVPTEEELARLRERVGWQRLAWGPDGRLTRLAPGVELDLSAIAKGYAVDAVVDELARDRPLGVLVEIGGEVRALGTTASGGPWRVGVENPIAPGTELEAVVALSGGALATSGDYRQFRVTEGRARTHVLDPRTGRPVEGGVASASVVAPTCMEADAVATALMVLGPREGLAWVEERPWLEALLLLREGDRIVERRASSGWPRWLAREDES